LRGKVLADPRGWIAQQVVHLSTVPTLVGDNLRPRHVDLRPFAVNDGKEVYVLPGGLTRVALPEGQLVVNSSQGGGSKDTWVLAGSAAPVDPVRIEQTPPRGVASDPGPKRHAGSGVLRQQAAQQQQQGPRC
jgi:uncharacterized circularly permuted ATP-grasp superfamily protein